MGKIPATKTYRKALLEDLPQFLGLLVAGILDLEVATLVDDLLSGEGALGVAPPRIAPPLLDLLNLLREELVLQRGINRGVLHVVGRHCVRFLCGIN